MTPIGIKIIKRNREYRVKLNTYFLKKNSEEGFLKINKNRKFLDHLITDRAATALVDLGHAIYIHNSFEIDL